MIQRTGFTGAVVRAAATSHGLIAVAVALVAIPGWVTVVLLEVVADSPQLSVEGTGSLAEIGHQIAVCGTGIGASGFLVLGAIGPVTLRRSGVWDFCVGAQVDAGSMRRAALRCAWLIGLALMAVVTVEQSVIAVLVASEVPFDGLGDGVAFLSACAVWWTTVGWMVGTASRGWAVPVGAAVAVNLSSPLLASVGSDWARWVPPFSIASAGADRGALAAAAGSAVATAALVEWFRGRRGLTRQSVASGSVTVPT